MAASFFIFIIFSIYNPYTLSQTLSGGIECIGIDACKATNLKCRPNRPCEIICNGKSACTDSTISANGATSFHLVCIGEDSCKSGLISCGTDKCQVDCVTYNIPHTNVCHDIFVHTNHARSFQCTGECPEAILPLQYTINPTQNPTLSPTTKTNHPTTSPTNMPSKSPSNNPTNVPTKTPTYNPISSSPTVSPSTNPTNIPTISPTNIPTTNPTTMNPSYSPSINPTISPSNNPSISPTNNPSYEPTYEPTNEPTIEPTYEPTNEPTIEPTYEPTIEPSIEPSYNPSIFPTHIPTKYPTFTDNPSRFPTINPTKTPTNYPTVNPTAMPTTTMPTTTIPTTAMPTTAMPTIYETTNSTEKAAETTQMGAETTQMSVETTETPNSNGNCQATAQNISSIFAAKSLKGNHIRTNAGQNDNLISYGIVLTITLNHELNINDATKIIDMTSKIMNELIHIIIPNNCLKSDPSEIKSVHSFVAMSINFQIFVCNNQQQQQLINIFNTNKNDILCQIIHVIKQEIEINIQLNSATLKTDTIEIYNNKNPINTTQLNTNNKDTNDTKYYGTHGSHLQLILLIMVGTLAVTSILIACAIFVLNSQKIKNLHTMNKYSASSDNLSNMINIKKKRNSIKKLSETGIEIESSSSRSDLNLHNATSNPIMKQMSEVNLHRATSDAMNLTEVNLHIEEILNAGEIENKCQCSCHSTEILANNDCVLRGVNEPEPYDYEHRHSGCCDDGSEQRQCCVIQEALYKAQLNRNVQLKANNNNKYGRNNRHIIEESADTETTASKSYELPKHAIV